MEMQPQVTHESLQAVLEVLPWNSLKSQEPASDDNRPPHNTGEAYYSKSFLYRPPDFQRTVSPSAQTLLQDTIQNLTASSITVVSITAEAKLFAIAVDVGRVNVGGLEVTWQSQSWLSRISTELQLVSKSAVIVFPDPTKPVAASRQMTLARLRSSLT